MGVATPRAGAGGLRVQVAEIDIRGIRADGRVGVVVSVHAALARALCNQLDDPQSQIVCDVAHSRIICAHSGNREY